MSEIQMHSYFLLSFFVNVCIFFALKKMTIKVFDFLYCVKLIELFGAKMKIKSTELCQINYMK